MRLTQVDCTVEYDGRGRTTTQRGTRLIITKDDGSVSVHADAGFKPVNYMTKGTEQSEYVDDEGNLHLLFTKKDESIDVKVFKLLYDMTLDFPDETNLAHKETEKQLQAWLSSPDHFNDVFGDDIEFVAREWETTKGAIDILGRDRRDGQVVLIEVKRYAKKNDNYQLMRYRTALLDLYADAVAHDEDTIETVAKRSGVSIPTESARDPHMILIAPKVKRGTAEESEKRGVNLIKISRTWFSSLQDDYEKYGDEYMRTVLGMTDNDIIGLARE